VDRARVADNRNVHKPFREREIHSFQAQEIRAGFSKAPETARRLA
jgi:hypothetical protein